MTGKFYQKIVDRHGLPVYWGQYVYRLTRLPLGNPWPSLGGYAVKRCRRGDECRQWLYSDLSGHTWITTAWQIWDSNQWVNYR